MDLHIHSVYSDGTATIDEIARKARERGMRIIAVVDHSAEHPRGLNESKARRRRVEIEQAEQKYGIRILDGVECGILEDGKIILPKHDFDLIIASLHTPVRRDELYRRIKRCILEQDFHVLGHLHAGMFSLDGRSEEEDMEILDLLEESGKALEINSNHMAPPESTLELCRGRRILYSFGSDAHTLARVGEISYSKKMAKLYLDRGRNIIHEMYNAHR
ncbi:Histidinol phosphatase and related hydrolases of the PHP family [Geoglobus ahangari]|uniref:Histidinol phosphatase and related hydrolases of the PHP family n=1 Tax=Geoglobus ahangari TaxID=113653 RepID=A0A0F7ID20_9EURY|nr:PHP domain-containing protein [Geoglobus ahangari]AKG90803.1 Histidinol phosphatase and related hydrolases of the PHP family [Geoglobus ahangari]